MSALQMRDGTSRRELLRRSALAAVALAIPTATMAGVNDGDCVAQAAARFLARFDRPTGIEPARDRSLLSDAARRGNIVYFDGGSRLLIVARGRAGLLPGRRRASARSLSHVLVDLDLARRIPSIQVSLAHHAMRHAASVRSIALDAGVDAHVVLLDDHDHDRQAVLAQPHGSLFWTSDGVVS